MTAIICSQMLCIHLKQLVVIPSILFSISHCAIAAVQYNYVAVDIALNNIGLQPGYGQNYFSNQAASQYNVFIGSYIARFIGIEIGYQQINNTTSNVFVPANTAQFGVTNFTGIAANNYSSKKSFRGCSISYVPHLVLSKCLSLIPILGVSIVKTSNDLILTEFDGAPATSLEQDDYFLRFATTTAVPRLGLRLQYLWKRVGIRIAYIWEQTSLLQPQTLRNINPSQILTAKFANSSAIGVGFFYMFAY